MNKYVQQVKDIVLDCMRNEPVHVYLFGSWARGTARQGSDVDVAVEYLIDMSIYDKAKIGDLRDRLEASTVPYHVDIIDMHQAAEKLVEKIRKEGIQWK